MTIRSTVFYLNVLFALCLSSIGCERTLDNLSSNMGERKTACSFLDIAESVFGPAEFHRSKGKPVVETEIFQAPGDGEICMLVSNGIHDPPQGHRVSAAWIRIDDDLVIDPDPFSQVSKEIQRPFPISSGEHDLSVRLASKPGSFLVLELRFLSDDRDPPVITISPVTGAEIDIDIPLITVSYSDDGYGVDPTSLVVILNGEDATREFAIGDDFASLQVTYDEVLPEGLNVLQVSVADRVGNVGEETSEFIVATPTSVLLADLREGPSAASRRAARKLLQRRSELGLSDLRLVLKRIADFRIIESRDEVLAVLGDLSLDSLTRAIAVSAVGEIASIDEESQTTNVVVGPLSDMLLNNPSWTLKSSAARSIGLTKNPDGLEALHDYLDPPYPPQPTPQDTVAFAMTKLVALQAVVRLSDDSSLPHNPPTWPEHRDESLSTIISYFASFPR